MQQWKEEEDWSERLIQQFEPLLHRVLQEYHVSRLHPEYQDLLQEGRLKILECYQKLGGNPFEVPLCYSYVAYIRCGFKWYCLHEFSIQNRRKSLASSSEDLYTFTGKEEEAFQKVEWEEELKQFVATLSPRQCKTFRLLFVDKAKITELAIVEKRNVSKYYRDLTKIRQKYQTFIKRSEKNDESNERNIDGRRTTNEY